jgi:hypothetical protein
MRMREARPLFDTGQEALAEMKVDLTGAFMFLLRAQEHTFERVHTKLVVACAVICQNFPLDLSMFSHVDTGPRDIA